MPKLSVVPRPTQSDSPAPPWAPTRPTLSEIFSETAMDAGGIGFMLACLPRGDKPILWVQDRLSRLETGRPYLPGLGDRRLLRVELGRAVDVLTAMEDGLCCNALAAVVGEIWGDAKALDFTATKRLALRAERSGVPCWLLRRAARADLSAARNRWRIASMPSEPHPHDSRAPGRPRWQADLFRSRYGPPGAWIARYDRTADRLDMAAPVRDGTLDTAANTHGSGAAG